MKRTVLSIAFFAALLVAWELLVRFGGWSPYVLPSPGAVWDYLREGALSGDIPSAIGVTLLRLAQGYVIGVVLGLPLGMLAGRSKLAHDTLGLLALGLQALPSVCWVPLACIWFGQTEAALLFIVVMGTLWSVLLSTENGIMNVPPIYARSARTMGASRLATLVCVTLPASAPAVVSGMKQGWAFAWRSLMAAEIYVSVVSGFGLGQYLHYGRELSRMDQVMGVMLLIILIGLLVDKLLFSPVEHALQLRWGVLKN